MATSVRLKACGGLGPYVWTVTGPATVDPTTGTATTVACSQSSSTAVVVTVTDAAGVSVSQSVGGSCNCGGCAATLTTDSRSVTNCAEASLSEIYVTGSLTAPTPLALTYWADCQTIGSLAISADADITLMSGSGGVGMGGFSIIKDDPLFPVALNSVNMQYNGATNGAPITGFAFFVTAASTPCNFTGFVFLIDHQNNRTLFGYYDADDITATMPTIIATGAMPANGVVSAYTRPTFGPDFAATDSVDTLISVSDITGYGISASANCGMIWVGNTASGTHQANWTEYAFDNNWTTH